MEVVRMEPPRCSAYDREKERILQYKSKVINLVQTQITNLLNMIDSGPAILERYKSLRMHLKFVSGWFVLMLNIDRRSSGKQIDRSSVPTQQNVWYFSCWPSTWLIKYIFLAWFFLMIGIALGIQISKLNHSGYKCKWVSHVPKLNWLENF